MEAIIKCYDNKNCTRELNKDTDGNYILDLHMLSSNSDNQYKKFIYYKNKGTHRAYRISLLELSDTLNKCTMSLDKTTLGLEETGVITINIPIVQGENLTGTFSFRLNYDNV